ncbi:MAG: D-alanyl-D-alanine carboxypeptidase/D-alanyl-D-alanine-endopeptidase, partial [Pseudomonadota bacterium]
PATALPPASVTKAVTALYALHNLGPEHRTQTRLIGTGPVSGGTLQGDLVLAGGGDPHLDTDGLAKLARALKARGIRRVSGAFRVYSGALPFADRIDAGQPDHVGYNPAVSGLNLNFNRVYFEWKRAGQGYSTTMDARTKRLRPAVRGIGIDVVRREAPLFTYAKSGGRERWTVARGALGRGGGRWLPVRDVDAYAGEVFRTLAAAQGVTLPAARATGSLPGGSVLAAETSATLSAQVRAMLKFSTNLTAEVVGLQTSVGRGARVGGLRGSAREMTAWAERAFGARGARFVDHSGLGDASRLSAEQMVTILSNSGWRGPLPAVLKDIPLINSSGKAAPIDGVRVVAKTGTLNFASALAGFIQCPNGKVLAFAIFSSDLKKRAAIARKDRDRPAGGASWRRRAKRMQQRLLRRWALEYGVSS